MDTTELALALAMVDPRSWPNSGSKTAIVLTVGINTLDSELLVPMGYRYVADLTGLERRWTSAQLDELVEERVLLVASEAAGSRGRCYAINPSVRAWKVDWRHELAQVEFHLGIVSGRLVPAESPLLPRYTAALTRIGPRHGAAQKRGSAAPWRGSNGNGAPRHGAAQSFARRAFPPYSLDSTTATAPSNGSSEQQELSEAVQRVIRVIRQRTGLDVFGRLPGELSAAMDGLTESQAADVERRIRDYPGNTAGPPILVRAAVGFAGDVRAGVTCEPPPGPELSRPTVPGEDETRELIESERRLLGPERPPAEDYFDRLRGRLVDVPQSCETSDADG